jgi:ketosteroid isomerase-like protein
VDVSDAARRWARTWERAWPAKDVDAIAGLYAPDAAYRSHPHRAPEEGGARGYVSRQFAMEEAVECRFGEPIAAGDRAAVEWWGSWIEGDRELTLSGTTVLRFDRDGVVVEHVDCWNESRGRLEPFAGWGGR